MSKLPVVVTGATGLIGTHLTKLLKSKGYEVILVTRKNNLDVCNAETLKSLPPFSALFHLAAYTYVPDSYTKTAEFFNTNITGTVNALELCKRNKAKFIYAGSYVYGQPQYLPVDEKHPTVLWNPYASSKIICEQLCQSYSKEFGIHSTSLRIFNVYGEGQNSTFLISKIIDGIKKGKLELETATPKRDFVNVADIADAFIRAAESDKEGFNAYNVGSGTSYSVAEIVDMVKQILGSNLTVNYNNTLRPTEVPDVVCNYSKINTELGWTPQISFMDGLRMLCEESLSGAELKK